MENGDLRLRRRKSKMMEGISITTLILKSLELNFKNPRKGPSHLHSVVSLNSKLDTKKGPTSKEYSLMLPTPLSFASSAAVIQPQQHRHFLTF